MGRQVSIYGEVGVTRVSGGKYKETAFFLSERSLFMGAKVTVYGNRHLSG